MSKAKRGEVGQLHTPAPPVSQIASPLSGVELWRVNLAQPGDASLLSFDEQARAARLVFPERRRQFIAARAGLRAILSACTGIAPGALVFAYGEAGKPYLSPVQEWSVDLASSSWRGDKRGEVHFNLAHSGELALVALARQPVGVDLESVRPLAAMRQMAEMAFTTDEQAALWALPPDRQTRAFFRAWTCKEAVMKAHGAGFRLAHTFSLPITDAPLTTEIAGGQVCDVPLGDDYAAAVALLTAF